MRETFFAEGDIIFKKNEFITSGSFPFNKISHVWERDVNILCWGQNQLGKKWIFGSWGLFSLKCNAHAGISLSLQRIEYCRIQQKILYLLKITQTQGFLNLLEFTKRRVLQNAPKKLNWLKTTRTQGCEVKSASVLWNWDSCNINVVLSNWVNRNIFTYFLKS